ncbi:PREDICTED: secretory carrier-associated membrane protein 1-like isoform X1 [Priapulus caudatus]|uniref:Secretory carrier-associated membrane protein n=1 Tax=Priapulus caudatus TaxID=37621 RepID=A0ABM1E068_PRICU|nr:PREDICTED: secretory carrier-associated membrane protein 1-like isoform X1 [Priapulus caudatus]
MQPQEPPPQQPPPQQPPPAAPSQPAIVPTSYSQPPPPYSQSGAQHADTADFQRRQEELEQKEAEIRRREDEINRQQNASLRRNNWPPLPAKCCVQPCFYQDIAVDIPLEFQRLVKIFYYLWMFYAGTMFLNVLGAMAYLFTGGSAATFGLSILFFCLFTPCSFVCWYRPVYKAFRSDSSINFFMFFFIFFFQFVISVIQALGFDNFGTCGWINSLTHTNKNIGAAAFMLIISFLFSLEAAGMIIFLIKVHRLYRGTGASWAKAQQEFATGVMTNPGVQTGMSSAARGAFTGATGSGGGGGSRF